MVEVKSQRCLTVQRGSQRCLTVQRGSTEYNKGGEKSKMSYCTEREHGRCCTVISRSLMLSWWVLADRPYRSLPRIPPDGTIPRPPVPTPVSRATQVPPPGQTVSEHRTHTLPGNQPHNFNNNRLYGHTIRPPATHF